jgi:predicted TIM-barrel fold metal-dependent hydrolase
MRTNLKPDRLIPHLLLLGSAALVGGCASHPPASQSGGGEVDIRSIPKVDLHAHYRTAHPELVPALEEWSMRAVLVNVTSDGEHEQKWSDMRALQAAHPERFVLVTTFDPFRFNEPSFAAGVIERLRADLAEGARAVKVWKNVGLELKDERGGYVQIDHPRFQPIWDFLAGEGVPVLAHIAEPQAAWLPLDEDDPHFWYYSNHPEYHAFQHPEMPRWEVIIAARDRWLARNPNLVVIGAHLGSLERDVAEVAKRLDAYPNFHVETAARMNDLAMQPSERVREFMMRYQDRVLWGTDLGEGSVGAARLDAIFTQHWSYFAGSGPVTMGSATGWNRTVPGLGLTEEVLAKLGHRNAERLLGIAPVTESPQVRRRLRIP